MQAICRDTDVVLKDWMLKRNCAMSPRQFVMCYLSLVAASLGVAVLVAIRGAWLVLPFTGLDLLAVSAAFVVYARHATDYEYIRLSPEQLVVEQQSADRLTQYAFNPRWVRIEVDGQPRTRITLCAGRQALPLGKYLAYHRREPFARELRGWLRRCA
ncbi:membrane protein [Pandoraea thiooxydans]|uniref:DUF2244 domain-containing protein n=1 Tax=Pandoraea thiooxydans TaxID=445709 RepID=A0A0G3ET86_9BURK|nr:DUF2244 domain-containing protein [Pandoraea thiooxydans]AKJ69244.1 hypothetical protein ABW99_14520 [Pandoraea thiooxydans]APR96848.1 membrane protein [Pandoraea thiooxydans]